MSLSTVSLKQREQDARAWLRDEFERRFGAEEGHSMSIADAPTCCYCREHVADSDREVCGLACCEPCWRASEDRLGRAMDVLALGEEFCVFDVEPEADS